jgi:hypothetical protein
MLRRSNPLPEWRGLLERRPGTEKTTLPQWIRPQLTRLADVAPEGDQWLHEIKFDGYRMHARLDRGKRAAANAHRARPDAQIFGDRRGGVVARCQAGLSRRRAVLRPARRHHLVQPNPERIGRQKQRRSHLFPVRSSPPRWRSDGPDAGRGTQGTPAQAAGRGELPAAFQAITTSAADEPSTTCPRRTAAASDRC